MNNYLIMTWIDGSHPQKIENKEVDNILNFIKLLNPKSVVVDSNLEIAKDQCNNPETFGINVAKQLIQISNYAKQLK